MAKSINRNQANATLSRKIALSPSLFIIEVKPDFEIPDFKPGQYVALGLVVGGVSQLEQSPSVKKPRLVKRTYSIASAPDYKDGLEFYIALVPGGEFTPSLLKLEPGARLFVAPKITGTFNLDPVPEDAELNFIATGTGIAPFISMLRSNKSLGVKNRTTLLHGVRYQSDLAYRDELLELEKERTNFCYQVTVSRPGEQWEGNVGYVQNLLFNSGQTLSPERQHFFLCGNPAMIEELETSLLELGFNLHSRRTPGNLHLEKYW